MKTTIVLLWALLTAAPVFSQQDVRTDPQVSPEGLKWFLLEETELEVRRQLGQPVMVAEFGEYRSWQYQLGGVEHDEFSHALVFRKSDGKLVSVSRNFDHARNVDEFLPENETTTHWFHSAGQPDFGVRVRKLTGGRVLIAVGVSQRGQTTSQLVLMRESELPHFYPWLLSPGTPDRAHSRRPVEHPEAGATVEGPQNRSPARGSQSVGAPSPKASTGATTHSQTPEEN